MSRSIRNYNSTAENPSWNIREYDPVRDEMGALEFYKGQDEFDVAIAEKDGEVIGYAAYGEKDGYGILDLIEVRPSFKGLRNGNRTVSKDLAQQAFGELEENYEAVRVQAKALEGPVQHICESRGYEVSGFQVENNIESNEYEDDVEDNVWDDGYSGAGFTAEMWRLDNDLRPFRVESYLSPELKEAAKASLPTQMSVDYLEPDSPVKGGIDYPLNGKVNSSALKAELTAGNKNPSQIVDEITGKEAQDGVSWIYTVDLDVTNPVTHGVSEGLAEEGWKLINLSPGLGKGPKNTTATMAKHKKNAGSYNLTPQTLEFVEATGMPFRIDEEGEKSHQMTFNPEDEGKIDLENADEAEIDEFYREIVVSD